MDEIYGMMEKFIQQSVATYKKWPHAGRARIKHWRICAYLFENGWQCYDGEQPEGSNSLILKWKKEGEEEKQVSLSFAEQQLWLRYLEKRAKREGDIVK